MIVTWWELDLGDNWKRYIVRPAIGGNDNGRKKSSLYIYYTIEDVKGVTEEGK